MRDILNRLRPLKVQTLFHGSPRELDRIEIGEQGAIFSDFDTAAAHGRYVHECEVDLSEGHDQPSYEGRNIRIWNPNRVRLVESFDSHCDLALEEDAHMSSILMEFRPEHGSHVLMVTGKLARAGLQRVMTALNPNEFTYELRVLDKAVAAWFDMDFIAEQIGDLDGVDIVLLPGKTMVGERLKTEDDLSAHLGVKAVRGTNCYSELPTFFEMAGIEVSSDDIVRPKIVMLGRPGSGKTTYGAELAKTYEIPHVSIGDVIRAGVEEGDETAIECAQHLADGELVPHNVMAELVRGRILMPDMKNGFVLDGYPRIARDIQWLSDMGVKPDAVVHLLCDEEEAKRRLTKRGSRNFVQTGMRIGQYEEETLPVVNHYRELPGFVEIDTGGGDVLSELYTSLEGMFQKCLTPNGRE
jgi:adenylate kinase